NNHRIQVFDQTGRFICCWGLRAMRPHEGQGRLHYPTAIAISPTSGGGGGDRAVICEPRENRCQVFGPYALGVLWPPIALPCPNRPAFGETLSVDGSIAAIVDPDRCTVDLFDLAMTPPKPIGT